MRKPVVLITGASGEIGHGLIDRLAEDGGRPIVTIDVAPLEPSLARKVHREVSASILDRAALERVLAEFEIDRVFHLAALLSTQFDRVVTVDPHLHRIASLDEVMPRGRGVALSAAAQLGRFIAVQVPGAVLVGPDEESGQWVAEAARAGKLEHAVGRKVRFGDTQVQLAFPELEVRGRSVVLLDDMASTGRTLIGAAREALERGAASVDVAVTHALFNGDALPALRAAGVRHIWSSNAVPHETNAVCIAELLATALRRK